ncbi:MAG: ABC transporter ATP-binding protein [Clostridiaceae bacterium]
MKVTIEDISFGYGSSELLKNINIELTKGQLVSIIGPNGAGKSTLLKCIATILKPKNGSIFIDSKNIKEYEKMELAKIQGYVPQNYYSSFRINVTDAVMLGRRPYIKWKAKEEDLKIVNSSIEYLGLQSMCHRELNSLSGGERQKVMIARALAQEPHIMLLDEPTSALDLKYSLEVMELLKKLAKKENKLIIVVMHNLEMSARYSDKLILMKEGKVHSSGDPKEVVTIKNLEEVYGVHCKIEEDSFGFKITPVKTIEN